MVLAIPVDILDTLKLLGRTHMKFFDISFTHDNNIILYSIYENSNKKDETHFVHLKKYY